MPIDVKSHSDGLSEYRGPARILLVEDDSDDAELFLSCLEESGCPVRVVRERLLALALRRLTQENFDLVFLDMSLPDSWGPETLRRVRKAFPEMPVVLMTGAVSDEVAQAAVREGAAACLFKQDLSAKRLTEILSGIPGP